MQDAGKAGQIGTQQAGIARQLLEGLGRGLKQGLVALAFMGAEKGSERLGDGEGEQEVRHGQLAGLLVEDPLTGLMLLALRAVTIAAGAMNEMFLTALGALIQAWSPRNRNGKPAGLPGSFVPGRTGSAGPGNRPGGCGRPRLGLA